MRFKPLLITILFASACAALPFPGMSGNGSARKTETSSSSTTEEMNVNGRPVSVAQADDEDDEQRPAKTHRKKRGGGDGDFGKTCHKNKECEQDACFTGHGDLGYCTKFCNSFSDCPTFWECKKPGNAPQRICMQDN